MFPFEKLEVWQKAVDFADTVYRLTKKFPDDKRFGLTSQMRRAVVSVGSNLAGRGGSFFAGRLRPFRGNCNRIAF